MQAYNTRAPLPRAYSTAIFDAKNSRVLLFGGLLMPSASAGYGASNGEYTPTNELWSLSVTLNGESTLGSTRGPHCCLSIIFLFSCSGICHLDTAEPHWRRAKPLLAHRRILSGHQRESAHARLRCEHLPVVRELWT